MRPRPDAPTPSVLLVDLAEDAWGAERVLLELAPYVRENGVRLRLLAPDGAFARAWVAQGFEHDRLSLPGHGSIRTTSGERNPVRLAREAVLAARAAIRVARIARHVDVVHSNHLFAHLECVLGGALGRRPVVVHVHDFVRPGLGLRLLRLAGGRAAAVAVTSASVGARLGLPPDARCEVLHPALDLDRYAPGVPDELVRAELGAAHRDDVLVVALGRLDHVKGVDLAIRAVASLEPHIRLAIVGAPLEATPAEVAELHQLGRELLGDRVRFVGPRDDVVTVLVSADILVSAARDEPFGASVLEAQACGIAVVVTDVGGHGEHVTDEQTGLVVGAEDVPGLGRAIARLAADSGLRQRLGKAARAMTERDYDVRVAARRLAGLYTELAVARR